MHGDQLQHENAILLNARREARYMHVLVLQWVFSFWIYSVRKWNNFTVYTVNCPIFVREVYTFVYSNVVQFRHY